MATFFVTSIGSTSASFFFNGLEFVWDDAQYFNAYCDLPGPALFPPAAPGFNHQTENGSITGLSPNTPYTANGYIVTASSATIFINSVSFTTTGGGPPPPTRPSDFAWTYTTVTAGQPCRMDNRDWNALANKIDSFRAYKGLGAFGYTTATQGANFEAFYYRQAVNGINDMSPSISVPPLHFTGDDVTAADIDRLRISLNSIA